MRIGFLHLVAICFMAMPAHAREIAVRSGEHEGFTRLVFYTKSTDSFDISKTSDGYLLSLSSDVTGYDLSRAFDLIGRSRIQALVPTENGALAIQQGCDCHIKELRLPTGELVIDVADGPSPHVDSRAVSSSAPLPSTANIERQRASLPLFSVHANQSELVESEDAPSINPNIETPSADGETPKVDKQELLAQLSRAASQGLIEAKIATPEVPRVTNPAGAIVPVPEIENDPHTPNQHVRTQTAVSQAHVEKTGTSHPNNVNQACLPDEQFNIAQWGVYAHEINAPVFETSSYLGEFDRPNRDLLVSHIRQNIYMTFGLEALQLLANYGDISGDDAVLRMMAEVVEYGEAKSHSLWTSQLTCNTRGTLWAALAQPTLQGRVNTNAILRSFSELPPHLRSHLAPILARKLLNSGRVETAVEVRSIAARPGHAPSGEDTILEAKINHANGETKEAEQKLANAVETTLTQTQPAISALIETKLHNGSGISDKELSLLDSVVFEQDGSEIGVKLQRLQIRALFHMGRFASAFELMDLSPKITNKDKLLDDAGRYLVTLGSDADFLTYSLTRHDWGGASGPIKLKMAERLYELGFHEQARKHVLSGDEAPSRNAREFLAKVALKQGKPKVALGYLAGLQTDNAVSLRNAATMQRDARGSKSLPEQTASTASDFWRGLNTPEHPIPETIQKALTSETPAKIGNAQENLQAYQSILDSSGETRTALDELLGIFPTIDDSR